MMTVQEKEIAGIARRIHTTCRAILNVCASSARHNDKQTVSSAQLYICDVVQQNQPLTLTELAKYLQISAPSTSVMVDRLVQKGILSRKPDPKDRRRCVIRMEPSVIRTIQKMQAEEVAPICDIIRKIGSRKTREWASVFSQIDQEMSRHPPSRQENPL